MSASRIDDPEILAFIARTDSFYPPDAVDLDIARQRAVYDAMCAAFRVPRPGGIEVHDAPVAGVPCRHYAPDGAGATRVLYFHGGGFVVGGLDSHDDVAAEIAVRTRCPVIVPDYRLCPEHAHPAAYDDALAVACTVPGPLILAGDSAGGNLAAAVALARRGPDLRGLTLIYPGLGGEALGLPSYTEHADAPMLTTRDVRWYAQIRAGGPVPQGDASFAPLAAGDLRGLPPCFVSAAGVDPLRDDGVEWVRRLIGAGVPAHCAVEPQLPHGHLRARHGAARARAAFERVLDAIREQAA